MIETQKLIKEFGDPPQRILHGIDLQINDQDFLAITGMSGSGKSTLLYILSSLDFPSSGKILYDGSDITKWEQNKIHQFRNHHIGFIFQFHYLLPEISALDNVLLPPRNLNLHRQKENKALELLDQLGIKKLAHKLPGQMSGGEQQRVAIARALIMDPKYIFADEPTGNLDSKNSYMVMDILKEVNKTNKTTIILVTHEPKFSDMATREIFLKDGVIVKER